MRRLLGSSLGALALVGGSAAAAVAASAPTVVMFSRWDVVVIRHGKDVTHKVPVGGTFQRCVSQRLYMIEAFYKTTGPSNRGDIELWYLNGTQRDKFIDKPPKNRLGRAGTFAIFDTTRPLASGTWKLIVDYAGKPVGQAAVTVVPKPGC